MAGEIGPKNPHTEVFPFGHVVYWKANVACGRDDEWDRAEVLGPNSLGVPSFVATGSAELAAITDFANRVHCKGGDDRGRQILNLLGAKP